jgi:putative lipoic acid-binding regulatory protein
MQPKFTDQKLALTYPCEWAYVLIGTSEADLRSAIEAIVARKHHTVTLSHLSEKGNYLSLKVFVVVHSDEERTSIYRAFHNHPATKLVL